MSVEPDSPPRSVISESRAGSPFVATDINLSPQLSSFSLLSPETPMGPADDSMIFEIEGRLVALPRDFFERNANYFRGMFNANPRSDGCHVSTKELGIACKIGVKEFLGCLFPVSPQPVDRASQVVPTIESSKGPLRDLDTAIFEVENQQFVVLKCHFIQSTISDALGPKWTDDEDPVKLDGVVKSEFEAFWKLLYALPGTTLSQNEWESVLKLTTKWNMFELRKQAVNQLTALSLTPCKRILLGREYEIVEWLRSGYIDLATKTDHLSMDDFRTLGLENALLLSQQVRRPYRCQKLGGSVYPPNNIDMSLKKVINDALEAPLAGQMASVSRDHVDLILLAQSLGVPEWLYAAYGDLAYRKEDITVTEAGRLGLETTLSICRMRERLSCQTGATHSIGDVGGHVDWIWGKDWGIAATPLGKKKKKKVGTSRP